VGITRGYTGWSARRLTPPDQEWTVPPCCHWAVSRPHASIHSHALGADVRCCDKEPRGWLWVLVLPPKHSAATERTDFNTSAVDTTTPCLSGWQDKWPLPRPTAYLRDISERRSPAAHGAVLAWLRPNYQAQPSCGASSRAAASHIRGLACQSCAQVPLDTQPQ
jgi:hypothetical protein